MCTVGMRIQRIFSQLSTVYFYNIRGLTELEFSKHTFKEQILRLEVIHAFQ